MPDTGFLPGDAPRAVALADVVVVIGLGYVGLPLAMDAATAGFRVMGYDTDPDAAAAAAAIWQESGGAAEAPGSLSVTTDATLLPAAGTWLVCVPTPLDAAGRPSLGAVNRALNTARENLARGALVCLISTCHPGATNGLCRRILERGGLVAGQDFYLAVSPERENPGGPLRGRQIPRLLGATDKASLDQASAFWHRVVDRVIPVASPEVAECAKLLENSYRLLNIALMDELHAGFAALGVPTRDVIEAAATKPFGFAPFWPGLGAGGHCIPIDPAYLQRELRRFGRASSLLQRAMAVNRGRPRRVMASIAASFGGTLSGRTILVAGVTYKTNVPDLRGAGPISLLRGLSARGARVLWHDPLVAGAPAELTGMPRVIDLEQNPWGVPDAIVIGTPHARIDIEGLIRLAPRVYDPFGLLPRDPEGRVRPV